MTTRGSGAGIAQPPNAATLVVGDEWQVDPKAADRDSTALELTRPAIGEHRSALARFADLSVRKRLIALVLLLTIASAVCLSFAVFGLRSTRTDAVNANVAFFGYESEQRAYSSWQAENGQTNLYPAIASSQGANSPDASTSWNSIVTARTGWQKNVAVIAAQFHNPIVPRPVVALFDKLDSDLVAYNVYTNEIHADVVVGNIRGATELAVSGKAHLSGLVQEDFNHINAAAAQGVAALAFTVPHTVNSTTDLLIILVIVAVLLAIAVTTLAVRSITRPLSRLCSTLDAVAAGDTSVRADAVANDEIGAVARGLNSALEAQERFQNDIALANSEHAQAALDLTAVSEVLRALQSETSLAPAVATALNSTRVAFDFAHGSYWAVDAATSRLAYAFESGQVNTEFARTLQPVTFSPGEGLAGRAWQSRRLMFEATPSERSGDALASAANRAGLGSAIAFPVVLDDAVVGTMEFYSSELLEPTERRLEVFRDFAERLSGVLQRISEVEHERVVERELRSKVDVILSVVNAAADGDLTVAVPVTGVDPVGQVGESLARFLRDLRERMDAIGRNSEGLASAAEELSATAAQMSAGAEETASQANVVSETSQTVSSSVQSVAEAADQLTLSIREIAKNAAAASRVATLAAEAAESTNATIAQLGESSGEIGNVVKVITEIAEQTNLLALNATIEAARAGEAGKGFAVVANEVKDLARETASATEDISIKIETIQTDTERAVGAIARIAEIVSEINDIQSTIAAAVEQQTATTNEIAHSVAGAADGAAQITSNINGVAQVAHTTSAGTADTERAAMELACMAAELRGLVGRFRV